MFHEDKLGKPYPLTDVDQQHTKDRILLEATILFAKHGYTAVSMRDLAKIIGIKPSSLYNHFENKEALWGAVLAHVEELYLLYFQRLDTALPSAKNFAEVLECMFVELRDVVNIFTYYGFSLVQTEQLSCPIAGRIYREVFLKFSISYIKKEFDKCVQKEWALPFDTGIVATFFMHSVLAGIIVRTHKDMGNAIPYEATEMFQSLHQYILEQVETPEKS